jgi:hypothetical protein
VPLEFLLPFEQSQIGQLLAKDAAGRLRQEGSPVKDRSRLNFMIMSCFLVSKVLVGELLEHKVAKRALFVGVHVNEPAYFPLYSFTMIGLLTDILFEAFAE